MSNSNYRFSLMRYVPNVVRGEFINVGVIVYSEKDNEATMLDTPLVRFTRHWKRVLCLDPSADIKAMEGYEQEIAERLRAIPNQSDPRSIIKIFESSLSNTVQISEPRGVLAENMGLALESLMQLHVEPTNVLVPKFRNSRSEITRAMRTAFNSVDVWRHMQQRVPASRYTHPGDPLLIDCSYFSISRTSVGGLRRMFQAVHLRGDLESAHVFALEAESLREGVSRLEGARLELTAVIEPLVSESEDAPKMLKKRQEFAIDLLKRQKIEVLPLSALSHAAKLAQRELASA
jgi:hypothetical protein